MTREPPAAFHALSAPLALERCASSERGLSDAEVAARQARCGPNALPEKPPEPVWRMFVRQFRSPLIYLLFVAAAIALTLGEHSDALVIVGVLIFNALIGTLQEGRAQRSMAALRSLAELRVRVMREGEERSVSARELVPGDLILLAAGDAVSADARVLDAQQLTVSEAALTGESLPVGKHANVIAADAALAERENMLFAGTYLTRGRARALVVAIGRDTELGKIAKLTESAQPERTPLERRVEALGKALSVAGAGVFVTVLTVGALRGFPLSEIFMIAISQLVSVVPEGLPVAMTIALALGMQRMAARRAIVRRLAAVESLGSTTVICTDKTGTLTRNEMTVTQLVLPDGRHVRVEGVGYVPVGGLFVDARKLDGSDPALAALCQAGCLCNDADLVGPRADEPVFQALGDPTEVALVVLARKLGVDTTALRKARPRRGEIPFDSALKCMATQHGRSVYVKGAPEAVLPLCAFTRAPSGELMPLSEAGRSELEAQARELAEQALRVLALAEVEDVDALGADLVSLRERAVFLGFVGQMDPPRAEVAEAIAACQQAGIRTVMITGDHASTGLAIARKLGIAHARSRALESRELARLSRSELVRQLEDVAVFARVEPAQKLMIVEALRERGDVVAMTGDGVNDAPALARADVGVAMGQSGTEVAKQASDIVVTDDNFATLVSAIEEGRVVYRNLKKALLLLLSTGLAEVLVLIVAMLFGQRSPFAAVQILWNNVITEGTVTVNLVMDPPEGDEMQSPPIRRDEPLLTPLLVRRMGLMTLSIAIATLAYFQSYLAAGVPFERARTGAFTLLAVCEWFNVLNCRSVTRSALSRSILKNRGLVIGLSVSALLQFAVVYVPALNRVFHTVPLPWSDVLVIGVFGSLVLWAEELRKLNAR